MKKILILTAEVGKTETCVADALSEQFDKMNVDYDRLNCLIMTPENSDILLHWYHSHAYRKLSKLSGRSYRSSERNAGRLLYNLCSVGADALHSALYQGRYAAVLCVHVFSCMMMTAVQKKFGSTPPFFFLSTDYACAAGVSELSADGYFVPHRMLFADFIRCGFPADRLYATGIPIRSRFYAAHPQKSAFKEELHLPKDKRIVLLRAGNLQHRVGAARRIFSLLEALPKDVYLVVLCGENEKLIHQLEKTPHERLIAKDFHVDPEKYLFASDLCITRPRAVFCTEALVCGIPLVLYRESKGLERQNFEFLIQNGVAEGSWTWRDVIQSTVLLLTDHSAPSRQAEAVHAFLPQNPVRQIQKIISHTIS